MKLTNRRTDTKVESRITKVVDDDFQRIKMSNEFIFDWSLERYNDIYKLTIQDSKDDILGLISLEDLKPNRIHISLLEVGRSNRGHDREYENVAGCLLAFAARLSILLGYDGFVTLEAKNQKLSDYYESKYGFIPASALMYLSLNESQLLIKKYIENE